MFSPLSFDTVFQAPIEVQSEGLKVRKKTLNEMIEMAPTPVTVKKVSVPDGSFNSLDELLEPGAILETKQQIENSEEEIKDITIEEEISVKPPVVESKKQKILVPGTTKIPSIQLSPKPVRSQLDELLKPVPVGTNSNISEHTMSSGGSLKSLGELLKPIK